MVVVSGLIDWCHVSCCRCFVHSAWGQSSPVTLSVVLGLGTIFAVAGRDPFIIRASGKLRLHPHVQVAYVSIRYMVGLSLGGGNTSVESIH